MECPRVWNAATALSQTVATLLIERAHEVLRIQTICPATHPSQLSNKGGVSKPGAATRGERQNALAADQDEDEAHES